MIPWPLCNLDPASLSTLISHHSPYSPHSSSHPLMSILQKYSTQLFPFHTLASLAEFSMFTRLDAIFTSVWIMCAFIKAGLLIFMQTHILTTYFGRFKRVHYIIAIGILTIITNLFISQQVSWFNIADNSIIKIFITGLSVFIIPLLILITDRKGIEKCAKQS